MIDLRSDTVTRPSEGMRRAMATATVGDDVYGEDPTVNRLEAVVAERLGKEAALFVPSGVMANQIALHVLTRPGDEVIVEQGSHIFNYESGAPALLSGVQLRPVPGAGGRLSADDVTAALRPTGAVFPVTRLVCLENTANKAGGRIYTVDRIQRIANAARAHDLRLHLDGARLWNASVATGTPEHAFAAPFDTVWVALSKGLGAPVGSVLAGSADRMARARRVRKQLGGGMRQSGILAAAGLYALEHQYEQLATDHANARWLAERLADLPGVALDPATVETNIIICDVPGRDAAALAEQTAADDVHITPFGPETLRITLHRDVDRAMLKRAWPVLKTHLGRAA
ncbi:threonine aldolase family protein [Salisaeta longa]|uniref:threonine aldolase family protein n=1 Tax=Salisaeta longa TaxID=503170 RepID=UPI0003B52DD6|nr:GntG family PLP-dependent aldolase [Salisaeta longa]